MQQSANLLEIKEKSIFVSARSFYRGQKLNASKLPLEVIRSAQAAELDKRVKEGVHVAK